MIKKKCLLQWFYIKKRAESMYKKNYIYKNFLKKYYIIIPYLTKWRQWVENTCDYISYYIQTLYIYIYIYIESLMSCHLLLNLLHELANMILREAQ